MSLCDRCPAGAGCCLDYLGTACANYRKREAPDIVPTNADVLRILPDEDLARFLCFRNFQILGEQSTLRYLTSPFKSLEEVTP